MFGIADYGAFCASILLFLALPGPGTFTLLTATAQGGFKSGAAATLGLIGGDQVLLWLAVAGVAALLASHPLWFTVVQSLGAIYLVWVGIKLLRAKGQPAAPRPLARRRVVQQAFLVTLLNPKAILFYMAFFPLFLNRSMNPGLATFVAMAATIAAITAVYCLLLCALANVVSATFSAHRSAGRVLQRLAGVVLIGFGIRLGSQ